MNGMQEGLLLKTRFDPKAKQRKCKYPLCFRHPTLLPAGHGLIQVELETSRKPPAGWCPAALVSVDRIYLSPYRITAALLHYSSPSGVSVTEGRERLPGGHSSVGNLSPPPKCLVLAPWVILSYLVWGNRAPSNVFYITEELRFFNKFTRKENKKSVFDIFTLSVMCNRNRAVLRKSQK